MTDNEPNTENNGVVIRDESELETDDEDVMLTHDNSGDGE